MPRALPLVVLALVLGGCSASRSAPDFTLQSSAGAPWTLSQQRDKAVVLTFGFTHCADTCPTMLARLARATRGLGARSGEIEIAFVTVDPQRDTPAVLGRYLRRFAQPGEGALVGLTGTPREVASVERAYHVWSQRMPHDVAHSAVIFLIDPSGRIAAVADDDDSESRLAADIGAMLG